MNEPLTWSQLALAVLGSGVLGGALGSWLNHIFQLRYLRRSELLARRRDLFEEITQALRVFVDSGEDAPDHHLSFLQAYSRLWLWAPDPVLVAMNAFLDENRRWASGEADSQDDLKMGLARIVLEMRRHTGFSETRFTERDYQFLRF